MSVAWLNWAFEVEGLKPSEKAVLICLANHADEYGYCYPSQERLARHTSLTTRSIRTACDGLEAKGVIERRREQARTNNYIRYTYDLIKQDVASDDKLPENSSGGLDKSAKLPENSSETTGNSFRNHRKDFPLNHQEPSLTTGGASPGLDGRSALPVNGAVVFPTHPRYSEVIEAYCALSPERTVSGMKGKAIQMSQSIRKVLEEAVS